MLPESTSPSLLYAQDASRPLCRLQGCLAQAYSTVPVPEPWLTSTMALGFSQQMLEKERRQKTLKENKKNVWQGWLYPALRNKLKTRLEFFFTTL